jgi:hypothetical protein
LRQIMEAAEHAATGALEGIWNAQISFFMSPDGKEYYRRFRQQLSAMPPQAVSIESVDRHNVSADPKEQGSRS